MIKAQPSPRLWFKRSMAQTTHLFHPHTPHTHTHEHEVSHFRGKAWTPKKSKRGGRRRWKRASSAVWVEVWVWGRFYLQVLPLPLKVKEIVLQELTNGQIKCLTKSPKLRVSSDSLHVYWHTEKVHCGTLTWCVPTVGAHEITSYFVYTINFIWLFSYWFKSAAKSLISYRAVNSASLLWWLVPTVSSVWWPLKGPWPLF